MSILFRWSMLVCLLGCNLNSGRITTGLEGKPLPSFALTLADSVTTFKTDMIPKGKPFILFCYQPYCPFCRAQTEEIIKNITTLLDMHVYMVSSWPYKDIRAFVGEYKLDQYPNITVVQDPGNRLQSYFQPKGVPFLAFYDPQQRLIRAMLGKHNINELKDNLRN